VCAEGEPAFATKDSKLDSGVLEATTNLFVNNLLAAVHGLRIVSQANLGQA
jgi:hypothetical protein